MTTVQTRKGKRILIVDDDEDSADVLREFLEWSEYDVSVAHDASRALALAASFRPAVILLDIHLNNTDGYDVRRQLTSSGSAVPCVIAITGEARIDENELRALGFQALVPKPLDLPRLLGLLSKACEH